MWNNDRIIHLIIHNRDVILPIIFPALEGNAESHWNHGVLSLTLNVRKLLVEIDDGLVLACISNYQKERERKDLVVEMRRDTWRHLESAAASLQPIVGNTAVLVTTH